MLWNSAGSLSKFARLTLRLHRATALPLVQWPKAPCSGQAFALKSSSVYTDPRKDFSLPNPSWKKELMAHYNKFMELTKSGSWERIPSYNVTVLHISDTEPTEVRSTRLYTRNLDIEGTGLEYAMFLNREEKKVVGLFQIGPYLEGPPSPIPLGSVIVVEGKVEKIEGKKIFLSSQVRSADDTILHNEASALFILLDWKAGQDSPLALEH
ncbi:acyl-coenzyme A thioesterase THEM4-like isoform X2 [Pleurodeles waltl]|uniref:acyl-coenzyme A thioesterase THEM4-like isoform X2 n=1 Tax=Pleurodeles waltl TaxID=8319 RepID=UPI0037096B25